MIDGLIEENQKLQSATSKKRNMSNWDQEKLDICPKVMINTIMLVDNHYSVGAYPNHIFGVQSHP